MNQKLTFEFSVNKETNTITVIREFAADLPLVWAAWTEAELLDQWWAPAPWQSRTKSMEFKEGGHRLYAMVGPKGEEHWGLTEFNKIHPRASFAGTDAFSDANGVVNKELPVSKFENSFTQKDPNTHMVSISTYQSLEQLEATIQMGFKEGMTMALEGLDHVLTILRKQNK